MLESIGLGGRRSGERHHGPRLGRGVHAALGRQDRRCGRDGGRGSPSATRMTAADIIAQAEAKGFATQQNDLVLWSGLGKERHVRRRRG